MKKNIYSILFFSLVILINNIASAQNVGINATGNAPDVSAMLDVSSSNKGVLIPKVTLQSTTDGTTISNPATGLMVYNTNSTMTNGNGVGFYYNSGTTSAPSWVKIYASNKNAWETTGNTGTTPSSSAYGTAVNNNFFGTTDAKDVVFATNNLERMRISSSGNVGIGTLTPGYRLDLNTGTFAFGNSNVRTETRDNAGLQGNNGAQSGFFETASPSNYPTGATSWWHLIDSRHSNNTNNYALQLSGSFFDQELFLRKTNNNASQAWTRVLTSSNFMANQYFDYSTSSITTSTSFQTIPGMSRTLTLNAGDRVIISAYGGMMANGLVYSSADIGIAVNNTDLADGGYTKVTVDYDIAYVQFLNWSIFGVYNVPTSGSYTFITRALQTSPYNGTAIIGGNSSSVLQGCMQIQVIKP
jgi:hypothetical protein